MKYSLLVTVVLNFIGFKVYALDAFDHVARAYSYSAEKIAQVATQTDCSSLASKAALTKDLRVFAKEHPDCMPTVTINEKLPADVVNKSIVLSELAKLQSDSYKCSIDKWESLKEASSAPVKNEIIAKMNQQIPELSLLKKSINKLTSQNQVLRGKFSQDPTVTLSEIDQRKKTEYEQNNSEIAFLTMQYNEQMEKIPQSKHPFVREFIEEHLDGAFQKQKTVTEKDFSEMQSNISQKLFKDKTDLDKNAKEGAFNSEQENQLAANLEHVSALSQKYPEMNAAIAKLRCEKDLEQKGKMGIEATITGASLLFTVGAGAITTAVRTEFLIQKGVQAAAWAKRAATLSKIAMLTGSIESANQIYNKCAADIVEIKPSCKISLEEIKRDGSLASCLNAGAMVAVSGSAWFIKKLANRYSGLNEYLARRMSAEAASKLAKDIPANLSSQITIANGAGRRFDATVVSFPKPTDTEKFYVIKYVNPQTNQLHQAKFTEDQFKILNPLERVFNRAPEVVVNEMGHVEGWNEFMAAQKSLALAKPAQPAIRGMDVTESDIETWKRYFSSQPPPK